MILIAYGANLNSTIGTPAQTYRQLPDILKSCGIHVVKASSLYCTAPVPASDQPDYMNAVLCVQAELSPLNLLDALMRVEGQLGRVRSGVNEARGIDLDLLAYDDQVINQGDYLTVPHPRMDERYFVLRPLLEIAPQWVHPVHGKTVADMFDALSASDQSLVA